MWWEVVHETREKGNSVTHRLKQTVKGVHLVRLKFIEPEHVIDDYRRGGKRWNLFGELYWVVIGA